MAELLHLFAENGLTLRVSHGLAVNGHRRLDAGTARQLLLDGERRPGFIQPQPIAVPERVPPDIAPIPAAIPALRMCGF